MRELDLIVFLAESKMKSVHSKTKVSFELLPNRIHACPSASNVNRWAVTSYKQEGET